ncbi:MAG: HAD-IB family phosphatase, partial [Anaerolineae bacterium]|nr:HAD-IB family phosphatase [Candidatus Roseilinea sp.]MDW8451611.1 HAD-IB family phosphatase [Anaerolineae bacterium]
LTTGETWRVVGEYLKAHGRAARYNLFFYSHLPGAMAARAGLINAQRYRERWFEDMTALLAGLSRAQIEDLVRAIADELWRARRVDIIAELERHRAAGARILIASGTYQQAAAAFAARIGAEAIGTPIQFDGAGRATGRLDGVVSTGEVKAARVRDWLHGDALLAAYGDTEGDIPMLRMAAQPVAVYPDAVLRAEAVKRGWRIIESQAEPRGKSPAAN